MRTFAHKQNQPHEPVSSRPARRNGATRGFNPRQQPIHLLQRTIGNQAVLRLLSQGVISLTGSPSDAFHKHEADRTRRLNTLSTLIQPKLVLGHFHDPLEQEADRAADQVLRTPAPEPSIGSAAPLLNRTSAKGAAEEEVPVLTKPATTSEPASRGVPSVVQEALRSPGQPLDASTRTYFEPRFGHDFSQVRVHRNEDAARSAEAIDALAYTVGSSIVFGRGLYAPETRAGRHLLAHELAHVVQGAAHPTVVRRQPRFGNKQLSKGWMNWTLMLADPEQTETGKSEKARKEIGKDTTYAKMQIRFLLNAAYKGKTVTFIQTVLQVKEESVALLRWLAGTSGLKPRLDVADSDFDPFYGADFVAKNKRWEPESAPPGYYNTPSSAQDPWASLYDEPTAVKGTVKLFESVAVVAETGEMLGTLRWGFGEGRLFGAEDKDCTDAPSSDMGDAVKRFHGAPTSVDPDREERYNAIVDGFLANDGVAAVGPYGMVFSPVQKAAILTADQEKKLDPLIKWVKELSKGTAKMQMLVGGFADPTEKDLYATSEQRAQAVKKYMVSEGVPAKVIVDRPFAAAWALYPSSVKEGRNRRVQIRVFFF